MNVLGPSLTGAPWAAVPSDPVNADGRRLAPDRGFAVPTTSAPRSGEVAGLTVVGLSSFSVDAADGTALDVCQPAGKWSLSEPPVPAEATWLSAGALGAALCELGATRKPIAAPITMATAASAASGPRRPDAWAAGRAAATGVGMGSGVGSGSATGSAAATGSGSGSVSGSSGGCGSSYGLGHRRQRAPVPARARAPAAARARVPARAGSGSAATGSGSRGGGGAGTGATAAGA